MNQDVKIKWVAALRSGEYKQGQEQLKAILTDNCRFCCLGVLCDLYGQETGTAWDYEVFMRQDQYPPFAVTEWAGLPTRDPRIESVNATLSELNDAALMHTEIPLTFDEIADLIEAEL